MRNNFCRAALSFAGIALLSLVVAPPRSSAQWFGARLNERLVRVVVAPPINGPVRAPWIQSAVMIRGFTSDDADHVEEALGMIFNVMNSSENRVLGYNSSSSLHRCIERHANRHLTPKWAQGEDWSVREAIGRLFSTFRAVVSNNGHEIGAIYDPGGKPMTGYLGLLPLSYRSIDITVNTAAIDDYSFATWTGKLFHEMAHNMGWAHPNEEYVGSFVEHAGECMQAEVEARL